MKNVATFAIVACLAFTQVHVQGQVPSDVEGHRYDLGLVEAEQIPEGKGDTLVVRSASWCGPCRAMKPQWKVAKGQGYRVIEIDVDKPVWKKPEDKELVIRYSDEARDDTSVPDVYVINSQTGEVVSEWHKFVRLSEVKKTLWKPSSSTGLLPDVSRSSSARR